MASNGEGILQTIRTRRVVRHWTGEPLTEHDIRRVVDAVRWAPAAGNRRVQHYVVVRDSTTVRLIKALSPGMSAVPAAIIVTCIDEDRVAEARGRFARDNLMIDVGTATQTILLAAHALGLRAGPVTSFSAAGVRVLLGLPATVSPVLLICLGHAARDVMTQRVRPAQRVSLADRVNWERFEATSAVRHEGGIS